MEEIPKFDKDPKHVWKKGEKLFVIDTNGFDIYEAELKYVSPIAWHVHYPDYPEDDFTARSTERFLVMNETNLKIFDEQQNIRACKAAEEEEEEEETEPDDPEDDDARIDYDDSL